MADKYDIPKDKEFEYKKDYQADWATHSNYINEFDAYEAMVVSQVFDSVSRSVDGSKITDGYTTTLAKERADRVIAKLPEGVTEAAGKGDIGKAAFMDILRQKWIYPNANAQHPFLEKLNMWQFYSSVYGYMPMFYDWNVAPSGYVGPDCWLWNPRNLIPQQGRTSIADMDYVTALTWVSKKFLQDKLDDLTEKNDGDEDKEDHGGWDADALRLLIDVADNTAQMDAQQDTKVARDRTPGAVKKGICLATRYEAGEDGRWCVFAPEHGFIQVRDIPNPHKNGRIPFVIKYSQPLFDSFYGLGDFQRGKPLQFARDGLDNFYFTGIKNQLVPPLVANANGVLKHTLDYRAGGVILETIPQSVRTLEVSSAGLSTYQGAKSALTGSLLAQFGSQNASIPGADSLNPSQGKTPQAIDLYADKEATRDGAELRHMEAAIETLMDGFSSLIVNIGTEDIPIQLFAEDLEDIEKAGMTDINELVSGLTPDATGSTATLRIKPSVLKGVEYRFNMNAGSTTKMNKDKALAGIERLLGVIGKFQNLFKDDPRIQINFPEIMKAYEQMSDIPGAGNFITFDPNAQPQQEQTPPPAPKPPMEMISYKDAPDDIKRQMEAQAGMHPSQMGHVPTADQALKAEDQMHKHAIEQTKLQIDKHKLALEAEKQHNETVNTGFQQDQAVAQHEQNVIQSQQSHELATKTAEQKAKADKSKGVKNATNRTN